MWYGVQNMSKYDIDIKEQPLNKLYSNIVKLGFWPWFMVQCVFGSERLHLELIAMYYYTNVLFTLNSHLLRSFSSLQVYIFLRIFSYFASERINPS